MSLPSPNKKAQKPLAAMPTLDDLVSRRIGSTEGQRAHVQTLQSLQRGILKECTLDPDNCPLGAEVTAALWAAAIKQLVGLVRQKEKDIIRWALDKTQGDYDEANFQIVKQGRHRKLDSEINGLQARIGNYTKTLCEAERATRISSEP